MAPELGKPLRFTIGRELMFILLEWKGLHGDPLYASFSGFPHTSKP